MRFLGAWDLDWDEFERRGEERRMRRYPQRTDAVTLVIGMILFFLIILWVVWGVMA